MYKYCIHIVNMNKKDVRLLFLVGTYERCANCWCKSLTIVNELAYNLIYKG